MKKSKKTFIVEEEQGNMRLDKFLVEKLVKVSRSQIQKMIIAGHVLINNELPTKHHFLSIEDDIEVTILPAERKKDESDKYPIDIVYEDDNLLVVNKASGLIVHEFAGKREYSLVDSLLEYYPDLKDVGEDKYRPGIVHRLDKNVSGLMIVAKTQESFIHLKKQFRDRKVKKEYLALVHGAIEPKQETIDFPIERSTTEKHKMAAMPKNSKTAKEAITHYELIGYYNKYSLLNVQIETGRTHQIRVHLNAINYPVVGDTVYTKKRIKTTFDQERIFLHAHRLDFVSIDGKEISLKKHLPLSLKRYLNTLTNRKNLILVSGPSGVGKTTLIKTFLKNHNDYGLTTTYTTREKRSQAVEDKVMKYTTEEDFKKRIKNDEFLEWAYVHTHYYGTHRESVLATLKNYAILANIDVQGAGQILDLMPEAYSIFIDIKNDKILRKRLIERGDISEEDLTARFESMEEERFFKPLSDFVIYNKEGKLDQAMADLDKRILEL